MSASSSRRRTRLPFWRYSSFWFSVAMITFGASTLTAMLQTPRDPYESLRLDTVRGWLKPIDPRRAEALPLITADLRAVHVGDNGKDVWVAGNAGTILYSADGGKTWTVQGIRMADEPAKAAAK